MRPFYPNSIEQLLSRAQALSGLSLLALAKLTQQVLPQDFRHAKGWLGQTLEQLLGATSGNLAQPDFPHLGVELKTLPLTLRGTPKESTYICTAPIPNPDFHWRQSRVYLKTAKILWVPFLAEALPLPERQLGQPFLWQMDATSEAILQQDWTELVEKINLGAVSHLSAHPGQYLQLRPKAANSKTLIQVVNQQGNPISIVPKGFYLRSQFTRQLLAKFYAGS